MNDYAYHMLIFLNKFLYDDNLRMRIFQVFFYTALSVFLMVTGIPNEVFYFGMPLAGLVSLIPLYTALSGCRSYREAGLVMSLFTGAVHLFSSFWLANFQDYAIFTIGASTAFYMLTGYFAGKMLFVPFSISLTDSGKFRENTISSPYAATRRILFFTCMWTILEWLKSNGTLAYPWGTTIMTAWKWKPITQIAALTGTWGISFLFSLFASTCAEIIRNPGNRHVRNTAFLTAALFLLTLSYGTIECLKQRTPVKTINAVLVQHNGDSWEESEEDCLATASELTTKAIEESELTPELVVWSEGILTFALPNSWWYYETIPEGRSLQDTIRQTGVPFIIGAPYIMDEECTQLGNSAVLLGPDASILDHYAKIQLVPFAEGIPFEDTVWMQKLMQALAGFSHGWKAGNEYKTFTVQGSEPIQITAPVCFEDAFPAVCRKLYTAGSEVFMNITNDSWSLTKSSEYQHYVISSYRAIEYRTTLVRSTNAGYTSVTDPAGRILADLPLFEEDSLLTQIPVYEREITVYCLLGDWVPLVAGIVVLLLILQFFQFLDFLPYLKYTDQ